MTASVARPVALIILDGWGYRESRDANAIAMAKAPVWEKLWDSPTRTLLAASAHPILIETGADISGATDALADVDSELESVGR